MNSNERTIEQIFLSILVSLSLGMFHLQASKGIERHIQASKGHLYLGPGGYIPRVETKGKGMLEVP